MELEAPQQVWKELETSSLYRDWKKQHPQSFLSHFFCSLTDDFLVKSNWEMGLFDPQNDKITTFSVLASGEFSIAPEDEVFKTKSMEVEPLDLHKVKISVDAARDAFKHHFATFFPQEVLGDGFLILQRWEKNTLWNFTFVTPSLKFINIKINAQNGSIASHDQVELVERGLRSKS